MDFEVRISAWTFRSPYQQTFALFEMGLQSYKVISFAFFAEIKIQNLSNCLPDLTLTGICLASAAACSGCSSSVLEHSSGPKSKIIICFKNVHIILSYSV